MFYDVLKSIRFISQPSEKDHILGN